MRQYFIGIDIGTSSTKAVMFDTCGTQVCLDSLEYPYIAPADGMLELDPEIIFNSTLNVIKNCVEKSRVNKISGMGMSCQMHSFMGVDSNGNPLTNLITWADTRAKKEAEFIESHFSVSDLYMRTGCRVQHPMYPLSKILWLKNNESHVFAKIHKLITIKEYIIYKLYGEFIVDYTLAASQGFFNMHKQDWDDFILGEVLGIRRELLSEVVECTHTLTVMKREYAEAIGLDSNIPLVIGSGDGIMANLGCGVFDSTSLSSTIGTSGAIRTSVDAPMLDPQQRTWCYSFTKDTWVAGGAINNGGIVLRWLKEEFKKQFEHDALLYNEEIYKVFDRYASEIPTGSESLIFLPYLTGERSPDWNSNARGMMVGLSLSHGRKHIVRAAMEGIMYRMYSIFEVMCVLKNNVKYIKANGGYTRSDVWLQMQADVFNREIQVSSVTEASALGAAYLAMVSLGVVDSIKSLLPGMEPCRVIKPIGENCEVYSKMYTLANRVYESVIRGCK